jgi:hypothetical protein
MFRPQITHQSFPKSYQKFRHSFQHLLANDFTNFTVLKQINQECFLLRFFHNSFHFNLNMNMQCYFGFEKSPHSPNFTTKSSAIARPPPAWYARALPLPYAAACQQRNQVKPQAAANIAEPVPCCASMPFLCSLR